uniref:helix-turn-helix domain-containing protein n=1 Tax=Arabiibacter massiliensis TaxID=1870985 RepID=UPI0009B9E673
MPIIMRLDRVMADRKISVNHLAEKIGIAPMNLSRIKTGKIKAVRFSTLEGICKELGCQPGDLIEYTPDNHDIHNDFE